MSVEQQIDTFIDRGSTVNEQLDYARKLLYQVAKGQQLEQAAEKAGIRSKADDPQPDPPAQPNTATSQTATAELITDQEADLLTNKLWQRLEARIDAKFASQEQAATKAAEPTVKALETVSQDVTTVKADVAAIKATLDGLTGQQSAGERYMQGYRASSAPDTIVNTKGGDGDDQPKETYAERLAHQRAEHMQQQNQQS